MYFGLFLECRYTCSRLLPVSVCILGGVAGFSMYLCILVTVARISSMCFGETCPSLTLTWPLFEVKKSSLTLTLTLKRVKVQSQDFDPTPNPRSKCNAESSSPLFNCYEMRPSYPKSRRSTSCIVVVVVVSFTLGVVGLGLVVRWTCLGLQLTLSGAGKLWWE